jgi:lipopolysaccharide biosynthesis regulator YciM
MCFRNAIRLDASCFGAYIELVHSYIREGREKDALKEMKKLIQMLPDYADIAINEFEELLYDMGKFDEIESFYKQIISANPKLSVAYIALAEIYAKKGELVKASEYARKVLQHDPQNQRVLLFLIQIENKLRRYESAAQLVARLCEILSTFFFKCKECGHQQNDYFWRCPDCRTWNSAVRA